MQRVEALHTAARRYCITQYEAWTERYTQLQKGREHRIPYTYSAEDLDTFPRYLVHEAIRVEIEHWVPSDFESYEGALSQLIAATQRAKPDFDRCTGQREVRAMNEEREKVIAYLRGLSDAELDNVEPLPHVRTLDTAELERLRDRLFSLWAVRDDWYRLEQSERPDLASFGATRLLDSGGGEHLRKALEQRQVDRVISLREGHSWESDAASVEWLYDGQETIWCDSTLGWIVYASHDSLLAVGGWLLADLRSSWPACGDLFWPPPPDQ